MFLSVQLLLCVTAILYSVYWYLTRSFNYWKDRNVPYKKPVPIFGNLLSVVIHNQSSGHYLAKLYNEFKGPYYGFFSVDKPFLIVKDVEIIKRILIKDFSTFPNRYFYSNEKLDPIISNSLFGLRSTVWKALRTKTTPLFSTGKIKMLMPLIAECAQNMAKYLEVNANRIMDTKDLAAKYTTDVVVSSTFGIDSNSFTGNNAAFREAGKKMFKDSFMRHIQPLAYVFAHSLAKLFRLRFFEKESLQFFREVFHKTVEHRERSQTKRNDLIDILIELKNQETKEDQFKFTGDRLLAQAVIFFSAGHETTSSTISFTLYELACNPDIQNRLRAEINTVTEEFGKITYESIQNMKYLNMIISETLRKYPVSPFLQRLCEEDYVIQETGLTIERGVVVLIPLHGLQWDPQHFPNPEKYDPERFSDENKSTINPYAYLPFGGGPRSCIGERLGLLNAKLGVLYVVKKFKVDVTPQTKIPLSFGRAFLLHSKGGVPLTYTPVKK